MYLKTEPILWEIFDSQYFEVFADASNGDNQQQSKGCGIFPWIPKFEIIFLLK